MLRLLGLLSGLSAAMDLGAGAPLEESLKRCIVATRLARATECTSDEVRDVLYSALLEHLGCTAYSHELGRTFGHDIATIRAGFLSNPAEPADLLKTFVPMVAKASGRTRARTMAAVLTNGRRVDRVGPVATCEVAERSAVRLGLSPAVQDCLAHATAMWNGSGHPTVAADQIPYAARLIHVASVATTFTLLAGPEQAIAEVRRRAGTHLDPALAALLTIDHLGGLDDLDAHETVMELEPDPVLRIDDTGTVAIAATFGDLADLKSPWHQGHSRAVAVLAEAAAAERGLDRTARATILVSGHLHDLGRIGVSSRIWAKATILSPAERGQIELHPWHTEQILSRVPALADASTAAVQHHERLDGSGYHRGSLATRLGPASRILAAADRYQGLIEERPYRSAYTSDQARTLLEDDARNGRLDADSVAAVLTVAGHGRAAPPRPAGLTDRQVDVLRLVARGLSNAEIGAELVISTRTAEHHVQDLYARIGVSTRAGAALFAMEHGLLAADG